MGSYRRYTRAELNCRIKIEQLRDSVNRKLWQFMAKPYWYALKVLISIWGTKWSMQAIDMVSLGLHVGVGYTGG